MLLFSGNDPTIFYVAQATHLMILGFSLSHHIQSLLLTVTLWDTYLVKHAGVFPVSANLGHCPLSLSRAVSQVNGLHALLHVL